MVDICPFKAQERMNDVCKNNYFSPRTKQSYTKLSKLEDTNKKGCPRFPEQPLLFSFYTSVLIFNSTYTYAVPIRFGKHVTYALTLIVLTASARAAAILALTSTLPSGEAYPLIITFESGYFFM